MGRDVALLTQEVTQNERLHTGTLTNGLEYKIIVNKQSPPNRFYANLQVRVGSLNEADDQKGIAHFLEHVVFLGTEKYQTSEEIKQILARLGMSWGGDSNAYTDFGETVYTFNSPTTAADPSAEAVPADKLPVPGVDANLFQVLDVMHQLAFKALLRDADVESERGAVLSELQMRNTVKHRLAVQSYKQMHGETALPSRFPIGDEAQIKRWGGADLRRFYERWYKPQYMTLFLVGDVEVEQAKALIEALFGAEAPAEPPCTKTGAVKAAGPVAISHRFGRTAEPLVEVFQHSLFQQFNLSVAVKVPLCPLRTLNNVYLCVVDTIIGHAWDARIDAILQGTKEGPAPLLGADWDYTDSPTEGCGTHALTVYAEPHEWKEALEILVREALRMATHGLTAEEFERCLATVLKESERGAESAETTRSEELIDDLAEDSTIGSVFVDDKQEHAYNLAVAACVTREACNERAATLFSLLHTFVQAYDAAKGGSSSSGPGAANGAAEDASEDGDPLVTAACRYLKAPPCLMAWGPVEMPTIRGITGPVEKPRLWLKAGKEEEPDEDGDEDEEDDEDEQAGPAGQAKEAKKRAAPAAGRGAGAKRGGKKRKAARFVLEEAEIVAIIRATIAKGAEAPEEAVVPADLVDEAALARLVAERCPKFVPVQDEALRALLEAERGVESGVREEAGPAGPRAVDGGTGVVMMQLSNGMRVNYKRTDFERRQVAFLLNARGGRALEAGVGAKGAVGIGMRLLTEGGAGPFPLEIIAKWCGRHSVGFSGAGGTDNVWIKFSCSAGDVARALQLLHLVVGHPRSEDDLATPFKRIIKEELVELSRLYKSPSKLASHEAFGTVVSPEYDGRMVGPNEAELRALSVETCRRAVAAHLPLLELSVVGDFEPDALEAAILRYCGTLDFSGAAPVSYPPPPPSPAAATTPAHAHAHARHHHHVAGTEAPGAQGWPLPLPSFPFERRLAFASGPVRRRYHIPDDKERVRVCLAFPSINSWGLVGEAPLVGPASFPASDPAERARRSHPMFVPRCLAVLCEAVNNRLYKEIREERSLLYSVSYSYVTFNGLDSGVASLELTPFPDKIDMTIEAAVELMRSVKRDGISALEFENALGPTVATMRTDLASNGFWRRVLTHLHTAASPKHLPSVRNIPEFYQSLTLADVNAVAAALPLDPMSVAVVSAGPEAPPSSIPLADLDAAAS
eukprot:tig00020848_g14557.t1